MVKIAPAKYCTISGNLSASEKKLIKHVCNIFVYFQEKSFNYTSCVSNRDTSFGNV